jgi:hypothetical protein
VVKQAAAVVIEDHPKTGSNINRQDVHLADVLHVNLEG